MRTKSLSAWRRSFQYQLVACFAVGLACEAAVAPAVAAATAALGTVPGPSSSSARSTTIVAPPTVSRSAAPEAAQKNTPVEAVARPDESLPQLWTPRSASVIESREPIGADSLFDGDARTGITAEARETVAVRLDLGSPRLVTGLGIHGSGRAKVKVFAEENGVRKPVSSEKGAALELTADRWSQVALPATTRASTLIVEWSASSSGQAALTELALWVLGRSREALSESAVADRLVTEPPENAVQATSVPWSAPVARMTQQGPVSAKFDATLNRDPMLGRAFLVYEVNKKAHWTGVSRSVNGHVFRGGYRADATGLGGVQVEEINPMWLRRGVNTISFQPTAIEDQLGYSVSDVRLVSVPRGVEPAPALAAAGGRSALSDGDLGTGLGGPGLHTASVPSLAGREPAFLSFYLDKPTGGTLTLSADNERARRRAQVRVDLEGRPAGWQTVPIAGVLPPASDLLLRVWGDRESTGQVSEARVQWFPALASAADLTVSYPLHGECNDHKTYVRGFMSGPAHGPRPQYLVDGQPRLIEIDSDGSFESYVQEPESARGKPWSIRLEVATESAHITRTVPIDKCIEPPKGRVLGVSPPVEDVGAPYGAVVSPQKASTLSFAGAKLEIPAGAVDSDVRVTMRALDRGQLSPLEPELDNVSVNGGALRFGPHGLKFKKPVKLTLPVDAARLPEGMGTPDVVAFFYDEGKSKWTELPKVLGRPDHVIAETTHFTDFIAGTLKSPAHPDAQQFNPNTMKNVKVGEPGSGITTIQPPELNSSGSARLSYPIETPPGRNGIGPSLALTYDSDRVNSNGWLGQGWDMRMSSIEIDTRFGVPHYDSSDVYLLDGAQLIPTTPAGTYMRRLEGAGDVIKRSGSNPTNYSWTVTDKNGTVYTYGALTDGSTRLANPRTGTGVGTGNVFRWYLDSVQDAYNNFMKITYQHDKWSTTTTPSETFDEVYPSVIDYTANGLLTAPTLAANYHVTFTLDAVGTRPDNRITARPGFIVDTRRRLDNITVTSGSTLVRQYKFIYYDQNPAQTKAQNLADTLQKSVLWAVALWGTKDTASSELYRHTFVYNKAPATSAMFGAQKTWGQVVQNTDNGFQLRTADSLAHSNDSLSGESVMVGVGFPNISVSGSFGLDSGGSNPNLAFVGITGQGLPDQIDNNGTMSVNTMAAGKSYFTASTANGVATLGSTSRSGWTAGGSIDALGGVYGVGANYARHVQHDNAVISDINGDGFPDIVQSFSNTSLSAFINDGKQNFTQQQIWTNYDLSNSPFSTSNRVAQAATAQAYFNTDPLLRWVAPFGGNVTVNVTATRDSVGGDGARVDLYYATGSGMTQSQIPLQSATFASTDGTTHTLTSTVNNIKGGDRIYMLVASLGTTNPAPPTINFTTSIDYVGGNSAKDPSGFAINHFVQGPGPPSDFKLAGLARTPWHLTGNGDIAVERCFGKSPTPDNVTVSLVIRNPNGTEAGRWNKVAPAGASGMIGASSQICFDDPGNVLPPSPSDSSVSVILNVSAEQNVQFEITSDTPVNPDAITMTENIFYYTRYCRPDRSHTNVCGAPVVGNGGYTFSGDPWPNHPIKYEFIAPNNLLGNGDAGFLKPYFQTHTFRTFNNGTTTTQQPMRSFSAPSSSLTFSGSVTTNATLTEDVVVLIQGVNKLYAKRTIPKGTAGNVSFTVTPVSRAPSTAAGDPLYFTIYSPTVIGGNVGWSPRVNGNTVPASVVNKTIVDSTFDNNGVVNGTTHDPMSGGFHRWFYGDWNDSFAFDDKSIARTNAIPKNSDLVMPAAPRDADFPEFWFTRGGGQISDGSMTTGRVSNPISLEGSASGTSPLRIGDTWNLTLSAGANGVTAAAGGGDSTTQVDFFDVNGDHFPDSVTRSGVAYNNGVSSFGGRTVFDLGFGDLRSTLNASVQAGVAVGGGGREIINETLTDGSTKKLGSTISLGGSIDYGTSSTRIDFVDVNGDGLLDHVAQSPSDNHLRVKLNLGYGFSNEIAWNFPAGWSQGNSSPTLTSNFLSLLNPIPGVSDPVGLVLSKIPGSPNSTNVVRLQDTGTTSITEGISVAVIGGGGGPTWTVTRKWADLIDVNGDGLPDQVLKVPGDPNLRVKLNLGDSFAPEQSWTLPNWNNSFISDYTFMGTPDGLGFSTMDGWGANLHFEFCFFVCFGMSGFDSDSNGGPTADFEDIDGDGKLDQVLKMPGDASVYAKINNTGHVLDANGNDVGPINLLTKVNRPLGGSFTIAYSRAGNHVDLTSTPLVNMPTNQWAMTSVVIDSDPGQSWNAEITELFDYNDPNTGRPSGYYDFNERENYGYAQAETFFPNEDTGTSITHTYINQNYYEHGFPLSDSFDQSFAVSQRKVLHEYQDATGRSLPNSPRTGTFLPVETATNTQFFEMQSQAKVEREERTYDGKGNLTDVVDLGDYTFGDPADDFNVHIDYQNPGQATQNITVPSAVSVRTGSTKNGGTLLSKRTATYTSLKPKPDTVTDVIVGGKNPDATGTARTEASPANATRTYTYDAYGNVATVVSPAGAPPAGHKVQYTYDTVAQTYPVTTKQFLDLSDTTLQYSSTANYDLKFGTPTQVVDITGARQEVDYDAYGRVTNIWAPTDFTGTTRNTTTPTIGVTYSEMPHTVGTTGFAESLPAWAMASHKTNAPGEGAVPGTALTATRQMRTVNFVDGLERSIQTKKDITFDGGDGNASAAMSVSGAVAFDARGRVYLRGQPIVDFGTTTPTTFDQLTMGFPTQFAYDVLGRLRQEQHSDNGVQVVTNISYQLGVAPTDGKLYRLKITTDPLYASDNSYHYRYDYLTVRDELKLRQEPNAINNVLTSLYTSYGYDPLSRVTRVTDAKGNITTAQFDSLGNLVQLASPDAGTREWRYCIGGYLCAEQSANAKNIGVNSVIKYSYTRDRLDSITYPSGMATNPPVTFTYGAANDGNFRAGRVKHRVDESGTFDYTYDALGNIATETAAYNSQIAGKTYQSYQTQYVWDPFGRLIDVTIPGTAGTLNTPSETIRYGYDAGGAVTSAWGKAGTAAATSYVTHVGYDEFGERVRIAFGNGAFSQYFYAADTRRLTNANTKIQDIAGQPARVAQALVYTYDLLGNIQSRSQSASYDTQNPLVPTGGTVGMTYTYDALNQLATATQNSRVRFTDGYRASDTYSYDEIGNITSKAQTDWHDSFDPNTGFQNGSNPLSSLFYTFTPSYAGQSHNLSSAHAPSSVVESMPIFGVSQTRTMGYDFDGNVASMLWPGSAQQFTWTDTDRLRSVCSGAPPLGNCGQSVRSLYRADGTRSHNMVTQGNSSTESLYVNQFLTIRNNGTVPTKHVYLGDSHVASKVDVSATQSSTYYYHSDNIQSTEYVTTSGQSPAQHLEYFPGGEIWTEDNNIPASYGLSHATTFSAKELDASGFYYFGSRYYDARTQMWLSPDPMLPNYMQGEPNGGVFKPLNLGVYTYAANNPVRVIDPDGRWPREATGLAIDYLHRQGVTNPRTDQIFGVLYEAFPNDPVLQKWAEQTRVGEIVTDVINSNAADVVPGYGLLLDGLTIIDPEASPEAKKAAVFDALVGAVAIGVHAGAERPPSNRIGGEGHVGSLPKPRRGDGTVPDGPGRDPKRFFTPGEREAKRKAQGGVCATGCGTKIDKKNSVGHHIDRWADGARSVPENHAEVCIDCHAKLHRP